MPEGTERMQRGAGPELAARTRHGRRRRQETLAAVAFLLPNIAGFLLFTLVPLVASLVISFFRWPLTSSPTYVGWHNYVRLFTNDSTFYQILTNTVLYVAGYVPLNIILSLGIAVWLSTLTRGRSFFRILFFIPVMAPMVGVALVWSLLYAPQNGVIDWTLSTVFRLPGPDWAGSTAWALPAIIFMSVWQGFGYNMLVFSAGLQGISEQYYEAAAIDGAGGWSRFWRITLPLLSPSLFFGTVLTIISSLQVFDQAFVLTSGGPGVASTTLVLDLYQNGFQYFKMGYASAIAWALFILIMLVTALQFFLQRKWVYYEA